MDLIWADPGLASPANPSLRSIAATTSPADGKLLLFWPSPGDTSHGPESDFLVEPYQFIFKGDPLLVDRVFQAVGFATRLSLWSPEPGAKSHYIIDVSPPRMVLA